MRYIVVKSGGLFAISKLEPFTGVYHPYAWSDHYLDAIKIAELLNESK